MLLILTSSRWWSCHVHTMGSMLLSISFSQWFMGEKETAGPFKFVVDTGFANQAETRLCRLSRGSGRCSLSLLVLVQASYQVTEVVLQKECVCNIAFSPLA